MIKENEQALGAKLLQRYDSRMCRRSYIADTILPIHSLIDDITHNCTCSHPNRGRDHFAAGVNDRNFSPSIFTSWTFQQGTCVDCLLAVPPDSSSTNRCSNSEKHHGSKNLQQFSFVFSFKTISNVAIWATPQKLRCIPVA